MKTSIFQKKPEISINRKTWKIIGVCAAAVLLFGVIFFFTYFKVRTVEVMGSSHYSEEEIKEMILQGPMAYNSVLAPIVCSKDDTGDIPFVEGFRVKQMNRNTIVISVKEKKPVGCIPYLDSYIYFDRNGIFIESSRERAEKVPYFDGIQVDNVIMNEKLPIKGKTILNTAVALSTIFQKNDMLPDHIAFDESNQISLVYGDITVQLGEDKNLEDKMAKVFSILPMISGKKGVLHLESVTDSGKPTFEETAGEITAENWNGGYDENGEYTGYGEYDENGKHVGPKPKTELDYALENWVGGYDEEGDYTGYGEYDENLNYVGSAPTQEELDANGDWKGGYNESGGYNKTGEYDRQGNYVGPKPESSGNSDSDDSDYQDTEEETYDEDSYGGDYYDNDSDDGYYDGYYDDSYDDSYYDDGYYDDGYSDDGYYDDGYYDDGSYDDGWYDDSYYEDY